jgi:hypothetical protein
MQDPVLAPIDPRLLEATREQFARRRFRTLLSAVRDHERSVSGHAVGPRAHDLRLHSLIRGISHGSEGV